MNYTIFFTNQCNMDCTYCYECNKMVRSTSYDVLDGIVNFIVEKQRSCSDKTVSIVTHGGEPLIEFDKIQYFIKRLNEKVKNVQYIITTNATLLTDLMIDFLSQHYSEISVSIDGIQSAHDANRVFANKKGSYAVVVEKAKKLLEKRSDVKARMTINPQTASTLYESVKHLLDLGFTTIVPVIDTFCNDWTEKDMEILLDQGKLIIDYIKDYDKITNVGLINDALSKMANSPCNGGTSTFSIDTDGVIYPCVVTVGIPEFVVGTIKEGVNKEKVTEILGWDKIEITECIGCSRYNYCNTTRCRMINKVIILYLAQRFYNKKIEQVTISIRNAIGKLNSSAQEMIGNLFSFSEGGLKEFFQKKHNKLETDYAKANIKGGYTIALNHSVLNFINAVTIAVLLGYGGYKVIIGSLSYGGLVTFNLYSQRFIAPILQLVQFNNDLTTCNIAWNRLNNLLNTKIDVKNGTQTKTIQGNIKFEDVTFYYEEKKPVLHDVFMEFKKGEIYAIVGQSGAGKTTLMHLLFRLWDCISGSITVDGIDIKDFDIDCLRGQISIVSQNIFLLNDTIYNNIVLGKEITDEELQHILVQAGLHEFINTLPNKLETVVGENGIKLSGGEKQRISIARALLKKNPILIFDEATSMLDNETEEKIISILLDSFKDTTIILIAHRLSTVKNANTIYVLNNGTIMEHGNHDQLLEQKGIYYHLYNI